MFKLLLNDFDAAQPLGKFFVYLASQTHAHTHTHTHTHTAPLTPRTPAVTGFSCPRLTGTLSLTLAPTPTLTLTLHP
jgi:hypothetical protein